MTSTLAKSIVEGGTNKMEQITANYYVLLYIDYANKIIDK